MAAKEPFALRRLTPGMRWTNGHPLAAQFEATFAISRVPHPQYLDGNQYSADVDIVSDPTLAGVRWHLQAKADGSWRVTNQGNLAHGLIAHQNRARLAPLQSDLQHPDPMADWLIYHCGPQDHVILRPIQGLWLIAAENDEIRFDPVAGNDPARGLWTLQL